ncbi:FO synthase subunit 1 [Durusdinium trenchii]|uniref:FO synthase subunit 1 n=1 Tax=Durusdinium trenchii TaxID=1381693 RepID=A0ABP0MTX2_9DINO
MDKHCRLVFPPDKTARPLFPELAKFLSQWETFVLASIDCCVWPANTSYLTSCLEAFHAVLAMSGRCGGHLQMPLHQAQTSVQALVKHRRHLEDFMMSHALDIARNVALIFQKPPGGSSSDKRQTVHPCLFVSSTNHETNAWHQSSVAQTNQVSDTPLIRVNEMLGYDTEDGSRKGVPAHNHIVENYVRGMDMDRSDVLVFADLLPNRHMEFGRAVLKRHLDNPTSSPQIVYIGFAREEQKDVQTAMENMVYSHWDASKDAPAKTRPQEAVADPELTLLTWSNGHPLFPASVLEKYATGTSANDEILKLKQEFLAAFPESAVTGGAGAGQSRQAQGGQGANQRARGRPDFNIDGGASPLDVTRVIDATFVKDADMTITRKAYVQAKGIKPALVIDTDFNLWLGNEGDCETKLDACELCGFNLGNFEEKVVSGVGLSQLYTFYQITWLILYLLPTLRAASSNLNFQGLGEKELAGIPFRFANDLTIVSSEKIPMSLAAYLHQICVCNGIATFEIANHEVSQKLYEA